jgi:hypothetical protein
LNLNFIIMALAKKMRVVIPTSPAELLDLEAAVYAKHLADGASSVLKNLQDRAGRLMGLRLL